MGTGPIFTITQLTQILVGCVGRPRARFAHEIANGIIAIVDLAVDTGGTGEPVERIVVEGLGLRAG